MGLYDPDPRLLTKPAALAGKTVRDCVDDSGEVLLVFTDGTFVRLKAEANDCGDEPSVEFDRYCTLPTLFNLGRPIIVDRLGLMTADEYDAEQATRNGMATAREKAEYDRLRAKFEPPLTPAEGGAS